MPKFTKKQIEFAKETLSCILDKDFNLNKILNQFENILINETKTLENIRIENLFKRINKLGDCTKCNCLGSKDIPDIDGGYIINYCKAFPNEEIDSFTIRLQQCQKCKDYLKNERNLNEIQ